MVFKFCHSLASRAAVSAVIALWYHEDIDSLKNLDGFVPSDERSYAFPFHRSAEYFRHSMHFSCRSALQRNVIESVSSLCAPESLKRYLKEFVEIIGENLQDFISSHYCAPESMMESFGQQLFEERLFDITRFHFAAESTSTSGRIASRVNAAIDVDLRKVLRWDLDGQIDLEQTGEALVRNEKDSVKRFRLACDYCREGEMLQLWPSVEDHFYSPEAWDSSPAFTMNALFWWRYFQNFWPESISSYLFQLNQNQILTSELLCSCFSCFYYHCSPLTLYLLNKNRQSHPSIIRFLDEEYMNDKRFGAILFRMPKSCFATILRRFPTNVFELLLCWRHQSFFVDAVERHWDVFERPVFDCVMWKLIKLVNRHAESDAYRSIFRWFWAQSVDDPANVVRFLYHCRLGSEGHTLGYYVSLLFEDSLEAECKMRWVLLEDPWHVAELLSGSDARVRDVLEDLVHTCLPAEEVKEKLDLLQELFREDPTQ